MHRTLFIIIKPGFFFWDISLILNLWYNKKRSKSISPTTFETPFLRFSHLIPNSNKTTTTYKKKTCHYNGYYNGNRIVKHWLGKVPYSLDVVYLYHKCTMMRGKFPNTKTLAGQTRCTLGVLLFII